MTKRHRLFIALSKYHAAQIKPTSDFVKTEKHIKAIQFFNSKLVPKEYHYIESTQKLFL